MNAFHSAKILIGAPLGLKMTLWEVRIGHLWENTRTGAFQLIEFASKLIDMSTHKGEHPRMGATDVCPLVPISNITMKEVSKWVSTGLLDKHGL